MFKYMHITDIYRKMTNNNGKYKERENYRKFSTITNTDTGGEFCFLCKAFDVSIYKRLRTLIERDIKANRGIIGSLPEEGEQLPDRFLPPEDKPVKEDSDDGWGFNLSTNDDQKKSQSIKRRTFKTGIPIQNQLKEDNQEDNDRTTIF